MFELIRKTSTNGRRGQAIVSASEGVQFPAQGSLEHIGTVEGIKTYLFTPGDTGTWVLPTSEVKIHGGATLVDEIDLQSSAVGSILLLGPQAVIEIYGYKRRSSNVVAYIEGVETEIPSTVLLAMGLLSSGGETVEIEPPPALQGSMAAAFAKLKR